MNGLSHVLGTITTLALCGCIHTRPISEKIYTPSEVVKNIRFLDKKLVHVRGYLILGDEGRGLWDSREAADYIAVKLPKPDDPGWDRCITPNLTPKASRAVGRSHPKMLAVTGRVSVNTTENSLDIGACSKIYLIVEDVDRGNP